MNAIKAIPTIYNGYSFRSRLEARWAVFFDQLGVKWEFEPEGFGISTGYYLPDFKIEYGDDSVFFEVKRRGLFSPACITDAEPTMEEAKLLEFSKLHGVFLVMGDPVDYEAFYYSEGEASRGLLNVLMKKEGHELNKPAVFARQAKFEHGQTPVVPIDTPIDIPADNSLDSVLEELGLSPQPYTDDPKPVEINRKININLLPTDEFQEKDEPQRKALTDALIKVINKLECINVTFQYVAGDDI